MDKEERKHYYRVLDWNNKHERMYTSIIGRIETQLNRYTSYLSKDMTSLGKSIVESRINALNSLKAIYMRQYSKKKSILESLGCDVHGDAVYLNDKLVGYIRYWKYIIRNAVDPAER